MRDAAELDLDHQLRLDPDGVLAPFVRRQRDRRRASLQFVQPLAKIAGGFVRVASADAAGVAKLAVLMNDDGERADGARIVARRRIAGNDEFLRIVTFDLDEILGPPGAI